MQYGCSGHTTCELGHKPGRHMNGDCQRWAELADQDALGEPLPSDGQAFQRAHEASCADCAREARLWRALAVKEGATPLEQREVESILSLAAQDQARRQSLSLRRKGALVILGGVTAAAAAALLWMGGRAASPGLPSLAQQQALRSPTVATSPSQSPTPALASAQPPIESAVAPSCSRVVPGATVCLGSGAVLGRRSLSGPHRELEVTKGRAVVSLDPQPAGTSFSLTTAAAKVTAVGTIFSVDVSEDGAIVTRVVEGKVRVRVGKDDQGHAVGAGQAFRVGEQEPTPLSSRERDLDLELLSIVGENERGGPSPSAGKPPARGDQASRPDPLEYARSLRAKGDFRQAAEVYRKIHSDSPSSPSGRAALVSLGELLLTLHDPQGALRAFESYLVGGGALAQEAMFGRVRALRALNRPGDEQAAIQRFLAAYPDAPQSRILRARLAAMPR